MFKKFFIFVSLFFASTFRPGNNLGLHKENNISDFIDSKFAEANKEDSECAKTSFFISMASIFEKIFDSNKLNRPLKSFEKF